MKHHVSEPRHWVIVPAAGLGTRMQADRPKQYLPLSGESVLEKTLSVFLRRPEFHSVCVGISPDDQHWKSLPCARESRIVSYIGGEERVDTVFAGLQHLESCANEHDWIWVHDAARPCVQEADLDRLFEVLSNNPANGLLLAAPIHDTVKRANEKAEVSGTVDRQGLWRALTPQIFRYSELKRSLKLCLDDQVPVTDECSAIEYAGGRPLLLEALGHNIKITRPGDLHTAMKEMENKSRLLPRVGTGFDVHAFEEGDHLVLGGVTIPFDKGLKAHSDGDVVLHALMDGMLGALALGDIGRHFPDTDARWKGADSRQLLRAVRDKVSDAGYETGNIDLTVIAEKPKLAKFIPEMQRAIADDLMLPAGRISLKATTTEKLGFTGRGEGIACQAGVILFPKEPE